VLAERRHRVEAGREARQVERRLEQVELSRGRADPGPAAARRELAARALPPMKRIPVVEAKLGSDAGMIGAAALARIELERSGG